MAGRATERAREAKALIFGTRTVSFLVGQVSTSGAGSHQVYAMATPFPIQLTIYPFRNEGHSNPSHYIILVHRSTKIQIYLELYIQ